MGAESLLELTSSGSERKCIFWLYCFDLIFGLRNAANYHVFISIYDLEHFKNQRLLFIYTYKLNLNTFDITINRKMGVSETTVINGPIRAYVKPYQLSVLTVYSV